MAIVELDRLTKRYGKRRGIEEVTFSIEEGEIFGFIGPNGAGKSTTIRLLLHLIRPTSGSARVFGKDIVRESRDIRRETGYLPSEAHYYGDMNAAELLRYSASFYGRLDESRMRRLAERLDLDLSRRIADLSLGNRKKVGIIQALLHRPRLLILDEPTGGLDPLMQHVFFDLLLEERERGATIFFSSHILGEVQRLCGRVAIIRDGRIVRVESVSELVRSSFKTVTMTFAADSRPQPVREADLPGVIRQDISGQVQTLFFNGNIRDLLHYAGRLPLADIRIVEPSLEEIFMHEYKTDEGA